jgi:hypothetical protein
MDAFFLCLCCDWPRSRTKCKIYNFRLILNGKQARNNNNKKLNLLAE